MSEHRHHALGPLHALPGFDGHSLNPLVLIKAVNRLHRLGFQAALDALSHFSEEAEQGTPGHNPENVLLAARLLFVPRGSGTLPELMLGQPDLNPPADASLAPLFPLYLCRDLPLLLVGGYILGGEGTSSAAYLRWCAESGALRPSALQPSDTPLADVDALLTSSTWKAISGDEAHTEMLRAQAWRAVAKALPAGAEWQAHKQYRLTWNAATDEYVA
jgi:hypothetical protein